MKGIIMIDFLDQKHSSIDSIVDQRKNGGCSGSGFILGEPGSGVSPMSKLQVISVLENTEDCVFVIDTQGTYGPLARQLDGQVIRLGPDKNVFINPFDIDIDPIEPSRSLYEKVEFLFTFCEMVMGCELTPEMKTIIDFCVNHIYLPYLESKDDKTGEYDKEKIPNMRAFFELIKQQPGFDAYQLADVIRTYKTGPFDIFAQPTNIQLNKRFIVFDMCGVCNHSSELLLVILEYLWRDWIQRANSRVERKWLFVDDICQLLKSSGSVQYWRQLCKVGFKYNCIFTGVTRHPDIFSEIEFQYILSNCSFLQILKLSSVNRDFFRSILRLSPSQISFLEDAPAYQSLVFINNSLIALSSNFSILKTFVFNPNRNYDYRSTDVEVVHDEIAKADVDVIVNAANGCGWMGGQKCVASLCRGVAESLNYYTQGAVEKEALQAARVYPSIWSLIAGRKPGEIFVTGAGDLSCKEIVHAVTMRYPGCRSNLTAVKKVVRSVFDYCQERNHETVAIPLLGCGTGRLRKEDVFNIIQVEAERHPGLEVYVYDK